MTYWPVEDPLPPVPRKAVEAAQYAALRYGGVHLNDDAARRVAGQVLECADDELRVTQAVAAEMWEREEIRDSIRGHQRTTIFVECATQGLLPVAWPREGIVQPAGPRGYGMIHVMLVMPVRRAIP